MDKRVLTWVSLSLVCVLVLGVVTFGGDGFLSGVRRRMSILLHCPIQNKCQFQSGKIIPKYISLFNTGRALLLGFNLSVFPMTIMCFEGKVNIALFIS